MKYLADELIIHQYIILSGSSIPNKMSHLYPEHALAQRRVLIFWRKRSIYTF